MKICLLPVALTVMLALPGSVTSSHADQLVAQTQCGSASWYALRSRTASGEMMNPDAMTAAHRSLPFGTKVVVRNERNGREVMLTINDRGPFIKGRIIDVSRAAATKLGFRNAGHTKVCLRFS